jgi:hypothetical protein
MSVSESNSNVNMPLSFMSNGIFGRTGFSVIVAVIAGCVAAKYRNDYEALQKPSWGLSFVAFVILGIIALVIFIWLWQRVWITAVNRAWVDYLFGAILLVSLAWVVTFFNPDVNKRTAAYLSILLLILSFGALWMSWSWHYKMSRSPSCSIWALVLFVWTLYLTVFSFSFMNSQNGNGNQNRQHRHHHHHGNQ